MTIAADPGDFRHVLGHYPTGVCVITAMHEGEDPTAMVVGSFTSASLDPPLIAFFPDRSSSRWQRIREARHFCVNVLAGHQEELSRIFAKRGGERLGEVPYRLSEHGTPILEGIVAWVDCELFGEHDAGDHFIALAKVRALGVENPHAPLLFHRGAYGTLSPLEGERHGRSGCDPVHARETRV